MCQPMTQEQSDIGVKKKKGNYFHSVTVENIVVEHTIDLQYIRVLEILSHLSLRSN